MSVSQGNIYFPSTLLTEDSNLRSYDNIKGFLRLIHPVQHNHIAFKTHAFSSPNKINMQFYFTIYRQSTEVHVTAIPVLFAYLDKMETSFTELY